MTQSSGPYGEIYDAARYQPDPYGSPNPYAQHDPYAQPGPYGPPPQPPRPPKKNLLPWLIIGGAVLLSGIGIMLVVLFTRSDSPSVDTSARSESPPPPASSSAEPTPDSAVGDLPGGAQVAEPSAPVGGAFPGSDGVAFTWVDAMADGDWQTAFDLSCQAVQDAATSAAAGGDPAYELGRYFYEQTLGGVGFTEGTFDSIQYDEVTGTDIGAFTLGLENGETFTLLVYVQEDLTVCDFL
jgi:hypothetical protein